MEIEFEKELLDLKAECRENPNIHPHCEHVVDLAISEIKRLEQQYETDTVWYHNKWMEAIKNSQASRWISMNDHLPDDSELVMLFAPAGTYVNFDWYDFGIYHKASNSFFHIGFPLSAQCPTSTHWMPLPEPPKEVE